MVKQEGAIARRIGAIGGGQLAWMMALEAKLLGIKFLVQTPNASDPAARVADETILAPITDVTGTDKLASRCDIVTFENEFINLESLRILEQQGVCFRPRLDALAPLLDKYRQRCYLREIGIPQPEFTLVEEGFTAKEFPLVLKARRGGYDGQGTFIVEDNRSLQMLWQQLGDRPRLLREKFVPFERELAVIAARSLTGEVVVYPVVETQQEAQVCRRILIPAQVSAAVEGEVDAIAHTLLTRLEAVGVFGIELFLTAEGKVLVNEVSPRTHNCGHFTLDACETSQFEQHLRAVAGLPLGSPAMHCPGAVMVNLLGYEYAHDEYADKRQQLASLPQTVVHWYGKRESRPGRKLGHVTALLEEQHADGGLAIAKEIEAIWYES